MTEADEVVDRFFAGWNETDADRRRELIARTWTEDGSYVGPIMGAQGHAAIEAMMQEALAQYPGHWFRRTGEVDTHHDHIRFAWEMGPEGGPARAGGVDVGVLSGGRLKTLIGFLDYGP